MKITLMGAGGCIERAGSKFVATMVECGDAIYFIDGGCSLADGLLRLDKDPTRVRAVFVTHYHGDHTAGIFPFVDLVNWAWRDCKLKLIFPTRELIAATERMILASLSYGGKIDRERLNFVLAAAGRVYEDEHIFVDYIPTKHFPNGGAPSYAILVTERASGKRVLFSGDLSHGLVAQDLPREALRGCALFVCELYHFGIKELVPYLDGFDGTLCIHHLFERDEHRDELVSELEAYVPRVIAPENGGVVEI